MTHKLGFITMILYEANRTQLISVGKRGDRYKDTSKGKNRYDRRTKSKVSNSVKEYNQIDMNKFFDEDILDIGIKVHGETDDYIVNISFSGLLEIIQEEVKRNNDKCDLRIIMRSAIKCFNTEKNIFIRCQCADFKYRMSYYASKDNIIYGDKENRPSDVTNPNNSLGYACKHILLVLSNTGWITKLSSTIWNYICYVEKHYEKAYAEIIFPKIYGKSYDDYVQTSLFDDDAMKSDSDTINKSNEYGRTRGQFKQGNKLGNKFTPKEKDDGQLEFNFNDEEN